MLLQKPKKLISPIFYPLELPLRYKMENEIAGRGRTIELNGDMVRFECDRPLPLGHTIQLVVSWPATLANGTHLNLWIVGCASHALLRDIDVEVARYEFRTRSTATSTPAATLHSAASA